MFSKSNVETIFSKSVGNKLWKFARQALQNAWVEIILTIVFFQNTIGWQILNVKKKPRPINVKIIQFVNKLLCVWLIIIVVFWFSSIIFMNFLIPNSFWYFVTSRYYWFLQPVATIRMEASMALNILGRSNFIGVNFVDLRII